MPRAEHPPLAGVTENALLAPRTTLELGGRARWMASAGTAAEIADVLRWAQGPAVPVAILGGGSNVVVADAGFDGLVLQPALRGVERRRDGDRVLVTAAAGEPWDELVAGAVDDGLAGLECLAGIPGSVGATPIQNVGAYGQEVAETIRSVTVLDRRTLQVREIAAARCGFRYRSSVFRRRPDRDVVLAVTFALRPGGAAVARYPELRRALGLAEGAAAAPPLATVRETVLALRRSKSMVIAADDPNRRSAGSFFLNPVVSVAAAERVIARALAAGLVAMADAVPRYPTANGRLKLAAGWLIEHAGLERGLRRGAVGISSRHALALVHHGGGTTAELVGLAAEVQRRVWERFGVRLAPEPVFLGFAEAPLAGATLALR